MSKLTKIAYLGPPGTFSEQAVFQIYGKKDEEEEEYEYVPYSTISDCFYALHSGQVSIAVIPFSNSTNGPVSITFDLMRDTIPRPSVIKDTEVAVEHYVVGSEETLDQIEAEGESAVTKIFSHSQVWGQCTQYLSKHFVSSEKVSVDSTVFAAQEAAEQSNALAISSQMALNVVNVKVYASNIQDSSTNHTRFLAIQKSEDGSLKTELDLSIDRELKSHIS
ncbi:Prephenate dehydratase [Dipodascopsis uninucleata]